MCRLGTTDVELADFFEVSPRTIANWSLEHDEFSISPKEG